jgi:NAD(P)-dependent dehydrogenase (short-subunit alcohol dehydrogenase family)
VKTLQAHGGEVAGHAADVRDSPAIADVIKKVHARFGEIDILVSGAAGNFPALALGMSTNAFKAVIDIDLLGTFNVLRAAHQFLKKPGACVISRCRPMFAPPRPESTC